MVEDKGEIVSRYLEHLRTCATPLEARATFPEMASVVDTIEAQFADAETRLGPRATPST